MSWHARAAVLLAAVFLVGLGLLCGWRYADVPGRWAYLGVALSIFSAISFTALGVAKADQVSESE